MADRLVLPQEHRRTLEALFREHLPDVEVWAYGSRVNGRCHPASDLDLVLRAPGSKKIPADQLASFADAVCESTIPFLVEARDWSRLPESFRREIKRNHAPLDAPADSEPALSKWPTATIGEVAEKVGMGPFGSSIKVETFVAEGVPIISGQHLHGSRLDDSPGYNFITEAHARRLANANVQRGDVLFTHAGNIGQTAYIPDQSRFDRYVISQRQFYMRCDRSKVIPEFVVAYFRSPEGRHKLLANASQVGVPSIAQPVSYLRTIDIPLPNLAEQRAIAHILGTLDDKIEVNRRMNETLEAMAQALFRSWFVDFEPVRAKIAKRRIQLPPHIAGLFPDRLVESDIGMFPRGWEISEIGREVTAIGGTTPSTKVDAFWTDGQHPWATPKDLSALSEPVLLNTAKRVTSAGLATISSGLLPRGTVLMSSRAPIGYLAIAETPVAVNQGFIAMVCGRRLPNVYVLFWCRENVAHIKSIAGGSTFAEISKKAFRPIPVLVPPPELLAAFTPTVRSLYDHIVANVKQNTCFADIRDLLLPRLVSGEFRVRQADQILERVV